MILREIILGGLSLPFKIYFQPSQFRNEIDELAPELPREYGLWEARKKWREPEFRKAILILFAKICISTLWAFVLANLLSFLGTRIRWLDVEVGVALGVVLGVVYGVALGVAGGLAGGLALGVTLGITGGVALGAALGVARVPGGVALAVTGGGALGVALGAALGVARGAAGSVAGSVARGVPAGAALGVLLGVLFGVSKGAAFGVAFGVAFGAAFGVINALTVSHLLVYPIQFCFSGIAWLISRAISPPLLRLLWRLSPARWDEIIILPLPRFSQFLVNLCSQDSEFGKEAIEEVSRHAYQNKAAYGALGELAFKDARHLDTLPALASFERGLDWLDSETNLPNKSKAPLLLLKEISQMIDAAEQSDTPRNKISLLRLAEEKAKSLRHNPGEFGAVLIKWEKLIAEGLIKAEEERRVMEPIRQVYFNDGTPISPDEAPEDESPFKGRLDTVRELEGALSDSRRATLLLTGNRRSGKSSLLLQLPRKLGPQVLPAFLDCQSAKFVSSESASGLLVGLAEEIMEQARRNAEKFRRDPVKFPRLDREAFERDPYPGFARWLEGAERALGGRKLLLCLDEFEKLEEALAAGRIDARFLSLLRNIIQHHDRIIVLMSGSHHLDELPPRWADALVTTQSLKIGFLDEADARELILHPVKEFPEIYEPAAVERILSLTRSQPYLVQLLCGLLVEKMNKERREPPASHVNLTDIESVIPQALERGEAYFNDLWRSQTGGNLARRVLEKLAFAEGERATGVEIRQMTEDEETLRDTIRTLSRREIIEPKEDGYQITVPLIAYYVRSQRQPF
jgi:uncharacterized protein